LTPLSQAVGKLDETSSLPLYQQLQRALRQAIESRVLGPTMLCRSAISRATSVFSRITVRKAIDGLVSRGMLVRRQAREPSCARASRKNFSKLTSFSEDMRARGVTAHVCCASPRARSARGSAHAARESGTPVYRFQHPCGRCADGLEYGHLASAANRSMR